MIRVFSSKKYGFRRDIYRKKNELYLTRYHILHSKWFSILIHKFHRSDYPILHDHPWNFISMPLSGSYIEHLPDGSTLERKKFSPKFRTANEFHWVEKITENPVWTFFITFKRKRDWGYLIPHRGWVEHTLYEKEIGTFDLNEKEGDEY